MTEATNYFESHITLVPVNGIEGFQKDCKELGVKGIIIQLPEGLPDEVMTSYKIKSNDIEFDKIVKKQVEYFKNKGYKIIRVKYEADMDYPKIDPSNPKNYFESHIQVILKKDQLNALHELAKSLGLHMSSNAFKTKGEDQIRMVTHREYGCTKDDFVNKIKQLRETISKQFKLDKDIECEYCYYDSRIEQDEAWLKVE